VSIPSCDIGGGGSRRPTTSEIERREEGKGGTERLHDPFGSSSRKEKERGGGENACLQRDSSRLISPEKGGAVRWTGGAYRKERMRGEGEKEEPSALVSRPFLPLLGEERGERKKKRGGEREGRKFDQHLFSPLLRRKKGEEQITRADDARSASSTSRLDEKKRGEEESVTHPFGELALNVRCALKKKRGKKNRAWFALEDGMN